MISPQNDKHKSLNTDMRFGFGGHPFAFYKHKVKEHFHHHNVDKDKESLRNDVTKVKKQIVSGEHIALHQRSELQKLTRIIQEADEERQRQARRLRFPVTIDCDCRGKVNLRTSLAGGCIAEGKGDCYLWKSCRLVRGTCPVHGNTPERTDSGRGASTCDTDMGD